MPAKKYKLPERFEDLPASDLQTMMSNPANYDMTMKEYCQVIEYFGHLLTPIAQNNTSISNNEIDKLKAELIHLKIENTELKKSVDHYKSKYENVMEMLSDIKEESEWDDEEDD